MFAELMREATRLTRNGRLGDATRAIQRALQGLRRGGKAMPAPAQPPKRTPSAGMSAQVLDDCVVEVEVNDLPTEGEESRGQSVVSASLEPAATPPEQLGSGSESVARTADAGVGEFLAGTHTHASLTRAYKLYVPPGAAGRSLPLVVMLHGCTQDPDDFAAGTGMNERAREQGFFVLYPAQSADANMSRCWNWFQHSHQQRGSGEPALIADLTRTLIERHDIDARRVYIAGLSAGGAMAAIVALAYPEVFAAVGVHSGVPRGAASSVPEALAVMRSGAVRSGQRARAGRSGPAAAHAMQVPGPVPTIVFHGDHDQTVHPRNGEQVIAAALAVAGGGAPQDGPTAAVQVEQGVSAHGRRYTKSRHPGSRGRALAEHWLVHGAGHAWSGGHAGGSFTDTKGPDATREMLRFFFEHPHL